MAETGKTCDEIVSHIVKVTESDSASEKFTELVENILENYQLAQASGKILGVKHVSASLVAARHQKARKSNTLQKARRLTAHHSASETTIPSPVSPDQEEEKRLVVEALRLAAMRDAMKKDLPDCPANQSVAAAIDQKLKSSLEQHHAMNEQASDDAQIRLEIARLNLR